MHVLIMTVSEGARQEKESRGHLKEQRQKSPQTWSEWAVSLPQEEEGKHC